MIAGASSSSSAESSERFGMGIIAPFFAVSRSVSCRFSFLVFSESFK